MPEIRGAAWRTAAAIGSGIVAYRSVASLEADALSPVAEAILAGTVGLAAAAIAAFMVDCMCRDPDQQWLDAFPRKRAGNGSSHEIDIVR